MGLKHLYATICIIFKNDVFHTFSLKLTQLGFSLTNMDAVFMHPCFSVTVKLDG